MKNQAKALLIAAALVLTATPAATYAASEDGVVPTAAQGSVSLQNHAPGQFDDLEGHFAKKAANRLGDMGLISKNVNTGFNPNAQIERQEFLDLLHKALGKEIKSSNKDAKINRLDVAVLIAQAMPAINTGINGGDKNFNYSDTLGVTAEEREALQLLYMSGLMVGDGQGHFSPNTGLTRGEAAVLLDRVVVRSVQGGKEVAYEKQAGELPQTVYTLVNENKVMEGLSSAVEGDTRYLLISGGEVPTGGFSVNVDLITETDAGIFVQASLVEPEKGKAVTEAIDHPYTVVTIKDTKKPVYLLAAE